MLSRGAVWWVWLGGLLLLLAHSAVGVAQALPLAPASPTAPELERARENFARGLEHSREGRFTHAALAFEEAYLRSGNPVALFNCASALREAGQRARAFDMLSALFARHAAQLDAETQGRAEQLRELTGSKLILEGVPEDARVVLDGVELAPEAHARLLLAEGEHRVEASLPDGRSAAATAKLKAGETTRLQLAFASGEPGEARESADAITDVQREAQAAPRSSDASRKDERSVFKRRLLWIGAAALVVVGAGVATGLALRSDSEPLRAPSEVSAVFPMP